MAPRARIKPICLMVVMDDITVIDNPAIANSKADVVIDQAELFNANLILSALSDCSLSVI